MNIGLRLGLGEIDALPRRLYVSFISFSNRRVSGARGAGVENVADAPISESRP
jgi:hypothetical protein